MGTSTNYKAPTSPQWGNLKRKVTRLAGQDTSDSDDIDVQDTPSPTDIDIQDIPDSDNVDIQDTPDSDNVDIQDTPSPTDIDIQGIVTDFVKINYGSSHGTSSHRGGNGSSRRGNSSRSDNGRASAEGTARRRAARNVARNIQGFFSSVANIGFKETFEQAGLGQLEGKSVREIAYSLLDYLGGPSSTLDQADARKALTDLMGEIFHDLHSLEDVEEAMERISDGESFADMIRSFFGHYINAQFVSAFYERITARKPGTQIFGKIRNFIRDAVKFKVRHQDVSRINWSGDQGQQIIDNIFQNTLEVFGL